MRPPSSNAGASPSAIGAVVVNYRAPEHLLACVLSLREAAVAEIVVVDNDSRDGSGAALASVDPAATFVPLARNLGYGAAANRGVAVATSRYVMIMNPDVVVDAAAAKSLAAALDADSRLALIGPRIENPDASLYPSARTFPSVVDALGHAFLGLVAPANPFSRRYKMLDWDHGSAREVDWVSGACVMARRSAFCSLGGFDEAYFMYLEDVDLCWRAWQAGWRVAYEPAARVVHVQGASTDLTPYRMIIAHHRSLLRFFRRTSRGGRRLLVPLVALGLAVRAALACAHHRLAGGRRANE